VTATVVRIRTFSLAAVVAYIGTIVIANWMSTQWTVLTVGVVIPAGTLGAGLTFTLRDAVQETAGPRTVLGAIAVGSYLSWLLASPTIAAASALAFLVSELLDTRIYTALRIRSPLLAVGVSNLAGLAVDTLLFVPLAFGSFALVPGQLLGKTVTTGLAIAALLALRRVARR
jgi:uncharacterized PurR-regulated membrane protein YhhQ (DUF165 family)